jgi:hypothetical protein
VEQKFAIGRKMTTMEKYTSFEQVLVDKIRYHCIDVPCCLTCAHGEDIYEDTIMCRVNEYYNPEMGEIAHWVCDHLGFCDNYKKKAKELADK